MPEAIARFRERHPAVELTLEPAEPEEALALLRSGEIDLALDMLAPGGPRADDGIDRVHLLDDPMYVALPRGHPLADKRNLRIEELARRELDPRHARAPARTRRSSCAPAPAPASSRGSPSHSDDYNADPGLRRRRRRRRR